MSLKITGISAPAPIEMSLLDANGRKIELNPQPLVTAEILKKFNANFLHDLHRLKKSYFVRPADAKKTQTVGEKLLNALKSVGHAVRSLIYSSKNAENRLHARFAELKKLAANIRNINIPAKEYKKIQKQTNANIEEIENFPLLAKEEHEPLLKDCLELYKNLTKELGFDKRPKLSDFNYESFPTDSKQRSGIQTLANDWKKKIENLTTLKDGKRIPKKKLSKEDIQALKDDFAKLSKAWFSFGEKQIFKNVMSQEEYTKYAELYGDIMNTYAKQQDKQISDFIRGNFQSTVQGAIEMDFALCKLKELQKIENESDASASVELRPQLQLMKLLLTLQASPNDKEALEKLLSDKERMPKDEDCIFLVKHLDVFKKIQPNAPLVQKIETVKSDLPSYLSACYEQNIVNPQDCEEDDKNQIKDEIKSQIPLRKELRNERLLAAAKLYASATQPIGVFNINIERLKQNLERDRKIFNKSEAIDNRKTKAELTPEEETRKFEMPDQFIRDKVDLLLSIREAFHNEEEAIKDGIELIGDIGKKRLQDLSLNKDEDISTAAKDALKRLAKLK